MSHASTGVFEAERTDLELFEVVGRVARAVNPARPQSLSQPQFDRYIADHRDELPGVPTARAIYMRVNADGNQARVGWQVIVRAACASQASARQTLVAARRSNFETPVTARVVFFALNVVARNLHVRSLAPGEYEQERQRIAASKERRSRVLVSLLPTANQLEQFAGSWDEALALANLEPRPRNTVPPQEERKPMGVEAVDAIGLYLEQQGSLPTRADLRRFARAAKFALSDRREIRWEQIIGDFREHWAQLGRWCPPGVPPAGQRFLHPAEPVEDKAATGRIRERWADIDDCARAVVDYWETLKGRTEPTQKAYGRWAVGKPYPAPRVFARHGGFTAVKERARDLRRGR